MSRTGGRRPLASRFCLGILCSGLRSSQEEAARPLGERQSAIERNRAAKDPSPPAAPSSHLQEGAARLPSNPRSAVEHNNRAKDPSLTAAPSPPCNIQSQGEPARPPSGEQSAIKRNGAAEDPSPTAKPSLLYDVQAARPPGNQNAIEHIHAANGLSPTAAPSSPLNVPAGSTEIRKKKIIAFVKGALRVAAAGLKAAPIPNLDQLPTILLSLIQTYETVEGNTEKLEELCKLVRDVEDFILQPLRRLGGSTPPEIVDSLAQLESDLASQRDRIVLLQKQKGSLKALLAADIVGEISATETRLRGAINLFNAAASTANIQDIARRRIDDAFSRLFGSVANAKYTSVRKEQCLPSTRLDTQYAILRLLGRHESRFVRLQGSPGTGKTAIAKSIAHRLDRARRVDRQKLLAASFFWDKTGSREGANSIEHFPCTLAYQLASFSPEYERLLVNHLLHPSSRDIRMLPLEKQMTSLVITPMSRINEMFSSTYPVIVLDGLDECGDRDTLEKLMDLVLLLDELPRNFVILVSSRPEPEIRAVWGRSDDASCVYTDEISWDDTDRTISEMVKARLAKMRQQRPPDWPSEYELRAFVRSCRRLPVVAEIRVREVKILARGLPLQEAFEKVKEDAATSKDLNEDYLRILQRAYLHMPSDVRDRYRKVVGTIIAAVQHLSVGTISKILDISEERIRAVLDPIGSILDVPADNSGGVHFHHATAKEFLTGPPQGDENDREFFFSDVKGTFLALPLLKILNCNLKRNMINTPNSTLLGEGKRTYLDGETLGHIAYAAGYWHEHLDLLTASEGLWVELRLFLTTKLLFWMEFGVTTGRTLLTILEQEKYFAENNADLPSLLHDAIKFIYEKDGDPRARGTTSWGWIGDGDPREMYRSILPFLPPSSPLRTFYGRFSDPIRVLRVDNRIDKLHIPSKQPANDGPIACAALSDDGRQVALGFLDGVIQVVDVEIGVSISQFTDGPPSSPLWLLFINGGRIATENGDGDIYILNYLTSRRQQIGSRASEVKTSSSHYGAESVASSSIFYEGPPMASLSHDGSMIVRLAGRRWYNSMSIIRISADIPTIDVLASLPEELIRSKGWRHPALRRSLGFSPDGQYVAAFDSDKAFVWSSTSLQVVAQYSIRFKDHFEWFLNTNRPSMVPPMELPDDVIITPIFEPSHPISSLSCVLYNLKQPSRTISYRQFPIWTNALMHRWRETSGPGMDVVSRAAGTIPQLDSQCGIWHRGRKILALPYGYRDPNSVSEELKCDLGPFSWPSGNSDTGPNISPADTVLPTSRDGNRFLICDKEGYPVVVDMSEVTRGDFAA